MFRLSIFAAAAALLTSAASAQAQSFSKSRGTEDIPAAMRPPPGMCRIWIDKVPADQQPAPTDCATAIRRRPDNARVIFGKDSVSAGHDSAAHADAVRRGAEPKPPLARPPVVLPIPLAPTHRRGPDSVHRPRPAHQGKPPTHGKPPQGRRRGPP